MQKDTPSLSCHLTIESWIFTIQSGPNGKYRVVITDMFPFRKAPRVISKIVSSEEEAMNILHAFSASEPEEFIKLFPEFED